MYVKVYCKDLHYGPVSYMSDSSVLAVLRRLACSSSSSTRSSINTFTSAIPLQHSKDTHVTLDDSDVCDCHCYNTAR